MYVCLCKAVTDKDIHRAVQGGASSMRCLRQQSGVGSQCGRCVGHAKEVLGEALADARHSSGTAAKHVNGDANDSQTIATAGGVGVCYP